jgi:hypothetical protein
MIVVLSATANSTGGVMGKMTESLPIGVPISRCSFGCRKLGAAAS